MEGAQAGNSAESALGEKDHGAALTASAVEILKAHARRPAHVDRAILDCFLLGASTRKVGRIMAPYLGEVVSPSTVSRIAKQLDGAAATDPTTSTALRDPSIRICDG